MTAVSSEMEGPTARRLGKIIIMLYKEHLKLVETTTRNTQMPPKCPRLELQERLIVTSQRCNPRRGVM